MTRPTTTDDLPSYSQRGDLLFSYGPALQQFPELQIAVSRMQVMMRQYAVVIEGDAVYTAPTATELEARLKYAQDTWDRYERQWEQAIETLEAPAENARWGVNNWASGEGLGKIEDAVAEAQARVDAFTGAIPQPEPLPPLDGSFVPDPPEDDLTAKALYDHDEDDDAAAAGDDLRDRVDSGESTAEDPDWPGQAAEQEALEQPGR